MNLLTAVAVRNNLHPAAVFKMACDYNEQRYRPRKMRKLYMHYAYTVKEFPNWVHDFCLDMFHQKLSMVKLLPQDTNTKGR
jgi:hypothetical protein